MEVSERQVKALILSVAGIGRQRLALIEQRCQLAQLSLEEWWKLGSATKLGLSAGQLDHLSILRKRFTPETYAEYLQDKDIELVFLEDEEYPTLLRHCSDRPAMLFVKGPRDLRVPKPLAVVGTRNITGYGETVTKLLVTELVNAGMSIISGGMTGVDLFAHHTALNACGQTIAVLGFGFDHWYPSFQCHEGQALLDQGATLITEFPPFMEAVPGNFPSRNRIVAGMSLGVLVTEAGKQSGSHITASCAGDYGREVFAVPGPISNSFSVGTKLLINQGAKLVSSVDDILEELGFRAQSSTKALETHLTELNSELEKQIFLELYSQNLRLDDLAQKLNVSIEELTTALSFLELSGAVKRRGECWMVS